MARILILDIENAPNLAYVWRLYDENVSLDLLVKEHYILSWAAKWYGDDEIMFDSLYESSAKHMLTGMHRLLNEADLVVHFNGKKHDIPFLNREFIKLGLAPPAPYKQIDLLTTVRTQFKFPSNRLVYVSEALGLGKKTEHEGYPLWVKCMAGNAKAWATMRQYNMQDVALTEKLYTKIRPWIRNHPNLGVYQANALVCPVCAGTHYTKRKTTVTKDRVYTQYQCKTGTCRAWFRDTKSSGPKAGQKFSTS